jgi:hypothetical protein
MLPNLILLVSSILLLTSIFECCLRILDYPLAPTYGWTYSSKRNAHRDEINELSSRGALLHRGSAEPLTPTVIVLLGDSQVECSVCSFNELPERRLEYYLNSGNRKPHQVFSIAASGWGQDQELLMLRQFFSKYRADKVVLWFTPQNDIWNNTFPTNWRWNGQPKPTLRLSGHDAIGPNATMGERGDFPKIYYLASILIRRVYEAIPIEWHNSDIIEYGKYLTPRLDDVWSLIYLPAPRGRLGIDSCAGRGNGSLREHIEDLLIYGREPVWEEKSHFNVYSALETPRLTYGLRLTSHLLKNIARMAAEHHAHFTIFTSGQFYSDKLFRRANDVIADLGNYCLEVSREAFERRIGTLLRQFDYVDVTPAGITNVYANNNRDAHLSPHGTDEAMRQLAEYIRHQE